MELAQLVSACEETGGGEEEVTALVTFCEARLASPVSQEMVRGLANTARTEAGRQRIRDSSLVQIIGEAAWDCRDHNTAIEVGIGQSTVTRNHKSEIQTKDFILYDILADWWKGQSR